VVFFILSNHFEVKAPLKKNAMKKSFLPIIIVFCLSIMATQCEEDMTTSTQADDLEELQVLKTEIEALANRSVCNESSECKYMGFGSKPCGGSWSYLIYSTSIDTKILEDLVENYNKKEAEFNNKWGIVSDCAIANPPSNIKCENNTCIAEYLN
jgi:hypothetical protein